MLRGDQLQAAHGWVKRRKSDAPEITEAQLSLLNASAEAEAARTSKEKQQLEDMAAAQSATATALSRSKWALHFVACVLVFAGLTFAQIVLQAQEIVRRDLLVFSSLAAKAYGEQEYDRGMRYALQAYPPRGDLPWSSFSTALEGKLAGGSLMSRLQLRLNGHTGPVSRASFSPDGRHIVTASFDNLARIWDAESGKEIAFLKGHSGGVNAASFSPDGKRVVTASDDQTAQIWDAESGKDIALLKGHTGWVRAASFSPDGKRVVTASSDQTAPVWDAETGKETAVRLASYSVSALRRIPHASRNG